MSNKNPRIVSPRPDGTWGQQRGGAARAGSVHTTQAAAIAAADATLRRTGGGELLVQGRNGQFRSKDTIPPGSDPRRIRDTEH